MALITVCIWVVTEPRPASRFSERMAASDSTISTALAVPATDQIQIALGQFGGGRVPGCTGRFQPTRAAPIGPPNGIPEMARAAEAPIMATMSGETARVHGHDGGNHLNLIDEAFREQRTDGTVDQDGR